MSFAGLVSLAARVMEALGVFTMLAGTLVATGLAVRELKRRGGTAAFGGMRQHLGRSILLGLEFLVAADIIRTVSEIPTLRGVIVLAVIVAIRTFLSFTLEVELEGRWPWQPKHHSAPHDPGSAEPPRTER